MAEEHNMEMLSALMGRQGEEALQMLQRVERLQRLMGTTKSSEQKPSLLKEEKRDLLSRSRNENIISSAIPFLDREYQKGLYVIVRLMEMRRVLQEGVLEVREKTQEPSAVRRRKMLGALQPYLPQESRNQMEKILKIMDMREIMGREESK